MQVRNSGKSVFLHTYIPHSAFLPANVAWLEISGYIVVHLKISLSIPGVLIREIYPDEVAS